VEVDDEAEWRPARRATVFGRWRAGAARRTTAEIGARGARRACGSGGGGGECVDRRRRGGGEGEACGVRGRRRARLAAAAWIGAAVAATERRGPFYMVVVSLNLLQARDSTLIVMDWYQTKIKS
jgi:hypothetical protein